MTCYDVIIDIINEETLMTLSHDSCIILFIRLLNIIFPQVHILDILHNQMFNSLFLSNRNYIVI